MSVTRRRFIQSVGLFGLVAIRSWSLTETTIADLQVQTLSDGTMRFPNQFAVANEHDAPSAIKAMRAAGFTGDSFDVPLNVTVLRREKKVILFDAGSGPDFLPGTGFQ